MDLRCSQCHTEFGPGEGDAHTACPKCKAEAGLEPVKTIPPAMRAFGMLLGSVILVAVAGDVVTRIAG